MTKTPDLRRVLETLEAVASRKKFRRISYFVPYLKQQEFFDLGAAKRERLLMAGNKIGKTEAGAVEETYHLTGEYPDDWLGKRFMTPTSCWAAGETSLLVRNIQQVKLCGPYGRADALGTGYIPKDMIIGKPSLARGVTDAFDTIHVKWGRKHDEGVSTLEFKSYEQGRERFQGDDKHVVWFDEEPDSDVYSEGLTRTNAVDGIAYLTFTPMKGISNVVARFLSEPSDDRAVVMMTIDDAEHYTPEKRKQIVAAYPAHEREARARGIPMLGSGRIFTTPQEALAIQLSLSQVPLEWAKLWALDFGIDHPFAAVLLAWDRDADVIYVLYCIRVKDQGPLQHWVAMKQIAANVPVAWPQDGTQRDKGSLKPIAKQYGEQGARILEDHATWPDGSVSTEAGVLEMDERMKTNRFKVLEPNPLFWEEYLMYHRKDGLIVKERDDVLSATRVGVMMKRFARPVSLGGTAGRRRTNEELNTPEAMAQRNDFDDFTGQ